MVKKKAVKKKVTKTAKKKSSPKKTNKSKTRRKAFSFKPLPPPKEDKYLLPPEEPSVSKPRAWLSLLINILLLPGLGSLIGGRIKEGTWQIGLFFGTVTIGVLLTMTLVGAFIGVPLLLVGPTATWVWGLWTGVKILKAAR